MGNVLFGQKRNLLNIILFRVVAYWCGNLCSEKKPGVVFSKSLEPVYIFAPLSYSPTGRNQVAKSQFNTGGIVMQKQMFFYVLWICLGGVCLPEASGQYLSSEQVRQDIASLRRILFKVHPFPDAYISKDSLLAILTRMDVVAGDSIRRLEWEKQVRSLLVDVGCGHTYLSLKPSSSRHKPPSFLLPMRFFSSGGRIWVREVRDTAGRLPLHPGDEIVAINGHGASELLQVFYRHQPADGYNRTFMERVCNKEFFLNHLYQKYFSGDSLQSVTWINGAGETRHAAIGGLRAKQLAGEEGTSGDTTIQIVYKAKKGPQYFYYQKSERGQIGVLRIAAFKGKGNRMYRRAVRDMNHKGVKYCVIDLRDNTGGSYSSSVHIARHVADRPFVAHMNRRMFRSWRDVTLRAAFSRIPAFLLVDIFSPTRRWIKQGHLHFRIKYKPFKGEKHYNGKVFVLLNGMSFSASSQAATYIQACSDAEIIGTETGGSAFANNGMQIPLYRLKGSGMHIHVPQVHLDYGLGTDRGHGVRPVHRVEYRIQDVLEGKDLEWEVVLRRIDELNQKR